MGEGLLNHIKRSFLKGYVRIIGDPSIKPGDLVEFKGIPELENLKGRVYYVEHNFSINSGFTTILRWWRED